MAIHVTSANGMGASTLSGSTITNTGMKVEDHMHISEDFVAVEGVTDLSGLTVAQNGTPNMSVNVAAGKGYILNQAWIANSVSQNRFWRFINSAVVNVAINANGSGNPRITSIFAKFTVATTPNDDADNVVTIVAVDGAPAATPTPPAKPDATNGYVRLADITVANGASSIVNANIVDARRWATLKNQAGWESFGDDESTVIFSSADAPSYVMQITGVDKTAKYTPGMRIRVTQSGTVKYFIITKVALSGSDTLLTLYGGTDYTLANASIYQPMYSSSKIPAGMDLSPEKWSVETTNTSDQTNSSPSASTWYNLGSVNIVIPIGSWAVSYGVLLGVERTQTTIGPGVDIYATLSTANNSESNKKYTAGIKNRFVHTANFSSAEIRGSVEKDCGIIKLTSKTTHYLNSETLETPAGTYVLRNINSIETLVIRAVCAYL